MSRRDHLIIAAFAVAATLLLAATWPDRPLMPAQLWACAVLTAMAAVAQLYAAEAPGNQTYYPHYVFFFAGLLLLPSVLILPLVAIPHLIEMLFARLTRGKLPFPWPVQIFNVAMFLIAGLTTTWVMWNLGELPFAQSGAGALLAPMAGVLSYVTLNHLIVGLVLVLINGMSWGEAGVLEPAQLIMDLVLCCLGYVIAILWWLNPWLILPAMAPLVLMTQALRIPKLEHEAQTDGKTGLLNARYLQNALEEEFQQARRQEHLFAVIMADLDYLRTVNNTYGHLAGDAAIVAIGQLIRNTIRSSDRGGRFGGEEFTILLPNTSAAVAAQVAERLRAAIEVAPITVPTRTEPIYVTMSFGVAEISDDMVTVTDLTDAADIAVYEAKSQGRNRVVVATPDLLEAVRDAHADSPLRRH